MKNSLTLFCLLLCFSASNGQTPNQYLPYSFQSYQKIESKAYEPSQKFHTAFKPFFADDSLIASGINALYKSRLDTAKNTWLNRKLFNEHLVEVNDKDFSFYADFLPDAQIGRSFEEDDNTWLKTLGYQAGGTIGTKFSYHTSGYLNQQDFPLYLNNYIESTKVISGQNYDQNPLNVAKDWSYFTALISYTPVKYVNFTAGKDKVFIGDGYRSMLLSDYGINYPFVKATATLGSVQYTAMWTSMQEPKAFKLAPEDNNRRKGGIFHYLDWNVNNKLSFGFFDAIIWASKDDLGNSRGFDFSYINPFVFLRPLEAMSGSPDNAMMGFTSKYKLNRAFTFYGQFTLDEFEAKNFFKGNGSARNKWGIQLGSRGSDIFAVKGLNYLAEFNTAKPFTYSSRNLIGSYTHYSEPLAHPFGANFKEFVGLLSYNYKRLDLFAKVNIGEYGYDIGPDNYGKDPFRPYMTAVKAEGNFVGQGLNTDLLYFDSRISYLINPKTNLRFEAGAIHRKESNDLANNTTNWLTFGLRSSFRNIYQDF